MVIIQELQHCESAGGNYTKWTNLYISECCGGKVSNKQLVLLTDFTKKPEYGDEVMADRGFNVTNQLAVLWVRLVASAYTKGKNQLSQREMTESHVLSLIS